MRQYFLLVSVRVCSGNNNKSNKNGQLLKKHSSGFSSHFCAVPKNLLCASCHIFFSMNEINKVKWNHHKKVSKVERVHLKTFFSVIKKYNLSETILKNHMCAQQFKKRQYDIVLVTYRVSRWPVCAFHAHQCTPEGSREEEAIKYTFTELLRRRKSIYN